MHDLDALPGHLIRRLHQISVAIFGAETAAAGFDLTPVQYAVLATIGEHSGMDQTTLAGLVALDRATLGGVVSRLETRGLLERAVRKDDRRARVLRLTPRGEALVRTIQPAIRKTQQRIIDPLDPDERDEFLRLLSKLIDASNRFSRAPYEGAGEQR